MHFEQLLYHRGHTVESHSRIQIDNKVLLLGYDACELRYAHTSHVINNKEMLDRLADFMSFQEDFNPVVRDAMVEKEAKKKRGRKWLTRERTLRQAHNT